MAVPACRGAVVGRAAECSDNDFTVRSDEGSEFALLRISVVGAEYLDVREAKEWLKQAVLDEGVVSCLKLEFTNHHLVYLIEKAIAQHG